MITPAYSPTATERVLPRMALDFTTAVLDSRVTVTRALNTATAINSSGFVAIVNANLWGAQRLKQAHLPPATSQRLRPA
jgi:hypothetical protein